MVRSMTGFGRMEQTDERCKFVVEIKAVNHRYCDLNIKIPKKLGFFEAAIRTALKPYIQRGKVDVFVQYESSVNEDVTLSYNEALASEYFEYYKKIANQFEIDNDIKASSIARCPEVLVLEEQSIDTDKLWEQLEKTVVGAAKEFVKARETEGANLQEDLISKLDTMLALVDNISLRAPQLVEEYKSKLENKVEDLVAKGLVDEQRIAAEIILFADKTCIDEELVRLSSHIKHMKKILLEEDNAGRKLDFVAQEMNRESNTILSKANDLDISNSAIDLKTEIEKIREQVQNIE